MLVVVRHLLIKSNTEIVRLVMFGHKLELVLVKLTHIQMRQDFMKAIMKLLLITKLLILMEERKRKNLQL